MVRSGTCRMEGGEGEVKFFQILMLTASIVSMLSTVAETKGKGWYVALFAIAGILYLTSEALSVTYF